MGHLQTAKGDVFRALAQRLDQNPIGAPFNETLMRILHIMYSEAEALIGSHFPQGFVTIEKLSRSTGMASDQLAKHLSAMSAKGLVIDLAHKGKVLYSLSPLVIGFFEYTFMRVNDSLPMKELAELFELYYQQCGVVQEFFGADTKVFQTWAYESAIPQNIITEVLDYEKASLMIRDAGKGSLAMCYCRHQALHRGSACNAPIRDVCTSLGIAAEWLIEKGFARPATADELLGVLDKTEKLGLVHLADNVQNNPAFICHCCGCCCGALRSFNEHGVKAVQPSNFTAKIDHDKCIGCGACIRRCHVGALSGSGANSKTALEPERCLGCGICVRFCPQQAITLVRRQEIHVPPTNPIEKLRRIAREKGKL